MLDVHAEEPFQASEYGAVDHDGAGGLAGFGDVLQFEQFRHVEIQLARAQLPGPLQGVLHEEIHLGAVEGRLARRDLVFDAQAVQHVGQGLLRLVPQLVGTGALGRSRGQVDDGIFESERGIGLPQHPDEIVDFVPDLVGAAEDVGVVLRKGAHPHQAGRHTGPLVAVQPGEIGVPDRQVAVGMVARGVHEAVAGTVHRLGREFPVVGVDGEHLVPEMLVMAGGLPQAGFVDQRRNDFIVAVLPIQFPHVIGQRIVDTGAFREEEGRRRRVGMEHEQPELPAQLAVVPPFGLGAPLHVRVQVLPPGIGDAVDPLEALVVLVAVPVGGRDVEQLEGLDLAGGRDVRTPAEVDELPLLIDADHLVRLEIVDHLDLVGLAPFAEQGAGVLAGELAAPDGHVRP